MEEALNAEQALELASDMQLCANAVGASKASAPNARYFDMPAGYSESPTSRNRVVVQSIVGFQSKYARGIQRFQEHAELILLPALVVLCTHDLAARQDRGRVDGGGRGSQGREALTFRVSASRPTGWLTAFWKRRSGIRREVREQKSVS